LETRRLRESEATWPMSDKRNRFALNRIEEIKQSGFLKELWK
jgi:hypothetical protein